MGGPGLLCQKITWCTNFAPTSAPPANAPALNGGTIADGFYRSEEGGLSYGYLFQGSQVLGVFPNIANYLGTYTVSGANLSITTTTECAYNTPDKAKTAPPVAYTFAVQGASLFLMSPTEFGNTKIRRFLLVPNPADACSPDNNFKCSSSSCNCSISVDTTIKQCS